MSNRASSFPVLGIPQSAIATGFIDFAISVHTWERLQVVEEYETALEELKSSNEELMSVNEELQSLNENLQIINVDLGTKVDALDRSCRSASVVAVFGR